MNITSEYSLDSGTLTISVHGAFDFKCHSDFRRAYESASPRPRQVVVDLKDAEYIDSSALGMLLLLREHAGGDKFPVAIANVRPAVSKILKVANFHQLFEVA